MGEPTVAMSLLDKLPKFNTKWVNIGLLVSAALMILILIICLATSGWGVDWNPGLSDAGSVGTCRPNSPKNACQPCSNAERNCGQDPVRDDGYRYCQATTTCSDVTCDFSLKEYTCSNNFDGADLTGDPKDVANVMAGLGAMCIIFLFIIMLVNVLILINKLTNLWNILTIVALVLVLLTWIFLTAGWGHYAAKKGGSPSGNDDVDYGASFAFTIIVWLCLFPFAFFWVCLWNQVRNPSDADAPAAEQEEGPAPAVPQMEKDSTSKEEAPATGDAHHEDRL